MTQPEESTEQTVEQRVGAIEEAVSTVLDMLEDLTKKFGDLDKKTVKKASGLFGGKRKKMAIKDTTTGTIYPSKSAVGKALYAEIDGGDPGDHFLWYKLLAKFPGRFTELDPESDEAKAAWKKEADALAKQVADAQAKQDAEATAEAAKTAKPAAKAGK